MEFLCFYLYGKIYTVNVKEYSFLKLTQPTVHLQRGKGHRDAQSAFFS